VLASIDQLGVSEIETLRAMQPELAQLYGREGTWDQIVVGEMQLPADLPDRIRAMWERNQNIAAEAGVTLSAQQFAEMFVDQNFSQSS
jgi:hypothetical protein